MKIRIGTRKSALALAQTEMVANLIKEKVPDVEIEIVHITTTGDKILDKPLAELGGKGVFISEIERALINNEIDIAVHSAKDLPAKPADGLEISAVLPRGNCCDVLISRDEIHTGKFIIGTGSLRRRLNYKSLYPNTDAEFNDIRGNIDTRLNKLANGEYDAIILAAAGLERLGLFGCEGFYFHSFDYKKFLPAPCQGIIAIESRKGELIQIMDKVNDVNTYYSFEVEKYILGLFGGDCNIPLGIYSEIVGENISLIISADSVKIVSGTEGIEKRFELAKRLVDKL